ncbi:Exosome component 3 [Globomyces sp. JEL0801]|nr:Exosome component 3 [Globomyces sp. JEL0801]
MSTQIIFPGEVYEVQNNRVGPGFMQLNSQIIAVKPGIVRNANNIVYYIPQVAEPVIGVITGRQMDTYRVDIGGPSLASLDVLAFEGATKRNRPNLENNALVYARVSLANKDMQPELECVGGGGKSEGLGELVGGYLVQCSLRLARSLMNPEHPILQAFGSVSAFEIVVGLNGRIWINAEKNRTIILLSNLIKRADGCASAKLQNLIESYVALVSDDSGNDMDLS